MKEKIKLYFVRVDGGGFIEFTGQKDGNTINYTNINDDGASCIDERFENVALVAYDKNNKPLGIICAAEEQALSFSNLIEEAIFSNLE